MNLLLKPVIESLQKNGAAEDEIALVIADLSQAATVLLYKEALENFSDADMQKIESADNDSEAGKLIRKIYSQRSGGTPEEVLNTFLKKFVEAYLEENNKQIQTT